MFELYIPHIYSNGWGYKKTTSDTLILLDNTRMYLKEVYSLKVWDSVILWRYRRVLHQEYPIEPEINKYNISRFKASDLEYDIVVDGGSYNLGFYDYLENSNFSINEFIEFEPDPTLYEKCLSKNKNKQTNKKKIRIENMALAGSSGLRSFNANGDFSARFHDDGNIQCEAICIDDYIIINKLEKKKKLNILIKLHIEGAELEAIEGTAKTIKNNSVDFIVNLTHTEEALIRIIPLLKSFKDYNFYLRSSSLFGEGLTLFAISPD